MCFSRYRTGTCFWLSQFNFFSAESTINTISLKYGHTSTQGRNSTVAIIEFVFVPQFRWPFWWFSFDWFRFSKHWCVVEEVDSLNIIVCRYRGNISSRFSSHSEVFACYWCWLVGDGEMAAYEGLLNNNSSRMS